MILGPLEVNRGGVPISLTGLHQRAALAFLLVHANTPVTVNRLMRALWRTDEPLTARKILQNAVSNLRRTLAARRMAVDLRTQRQAYGLYLPPELIDLSQYMDLVKRSTAELSANSLDRAAHTLREALALWRGDPLADLVEAGLDWPELAALRESRWSTLENRITIDLMLGRHREVAAELGAIAEAEPARERLCALQMLALYRNGRHVDALDAYRRTRSALANGVDAAPGHRLRELERNVLTHSPDLTTAGAVIRWAA